MPTLKQLTCNVEWSGSNLPLHEYQTIYADGFVETYVAVPPVSTPFSIHLRSHGYIAPGLAMFVYMDGEYQCNRNRSNLKIPSEARTRKQTEIDFHVRQKEELMPDGSFRGKQWKFVSMRTDDANKSFETLYHNISAKRPAPHDSQYIGTIEVVVLRCYPNQTSKHITPSIPVAESIPFVQSQLHTSSLAVDIEAGSQSSSDEESESSKGAASMMVEMFDGAADYPWTPPESTSFGGDMALDQAPSFQGRTQPRRPLYGGHTEGKESGNPSSTPTGNEHHFSTSESQKWHNRVAPERRGHGHENNAAQNIPPSSGRNSHHEPDKYTPNPPNRVPRHSPGTKSQKAHNSNGSNERSSNSNRSHHSPACSTAPRTNPSAVWVQPQGTPAQVAPAVVINVTQGTPHSANSTSPVKTPTLNIETAKVDVWQTGQPEKIDEYIQGPSQSPEGSNDSKASKRWNNSIASPVDNHADVLRHENSIEQHDGTQWHDTFSHAENNENQWDVVEDTWDSKLEHTTPKYHDDHQTWDNNMVGSYPLESSSMEAQNTSNGWSSNENNNASYHTVGEANIGNEQARLENSSAWTQPTNSMGGKSPRRLASGQPKGTDIGSGRAEKKRLGKFLSALLISNKPRRSVHPSPSGQGRQQTSLHPSNKSTAAKVACANDTSNSQYLGTNDNEASKYVASQPWSEQVPEQNEHGLESPQLAAPQIYELPVSIDTRARPYWSAWKQPHINKITSKAAVPRVEPAEPLYYVPSEVAQKNKMSHQVYVGQTAEYVHKRASPRYMDDFTSPYAVFVFKYRSKAILEQVLNTTLVEPEAQEKERLQDLSKEELIEQLLKAKNMAANATISGSSSSHTVKQENNHYFSKDGECCEGRSANRKRSNLPNRAIRSSDIASTNPEHHWGRGIPILNTASPHPEAKVASWLGGANGPENQSYGSPKSWSGRNGKGGPGIGSAWGDNIETGERNKFHGADAWAATDDHHKTTQTTAKASEEIKDGDGEGEAKW